MSSEAVSQQAENNTPDPEILDDWIDSRDDSDTVTLVGILAQLDPTEFQDGRQRWSAEEQQIISDATEKWSEAGY